MPPPPDNPNDELKKQFRIYNKKLLKMLSQSHKDKIKLHLKEEEKDIEEEEEEEEVKLRHKEHNTDNPKEKVHNVLTKGFSSREIEQSLVHIKENQERADKENNNKHDAHTKRREEDKNDFNKLLDDLKLELNDKIKQPIKWAVGGFTIIIGAIGTIFGLMYISNEHYTTKITTEISRQVGDINKNLSAIKSTIKSNKEDLIQRVERTEDRIDQKTDNMNNRIDNIMNNNPKNKKEPAP